MITLIPT
jgi:hypothetical protein